MDSILCPALIIDMARKSIMKRTYSIRNLITLVLNKLWLIGIFTFVFGLGSFLVVRFLVHPRYESYITMYVKNNSVKEETEKDVDLNDLNASKSLAGTYITVLKTKAVMKQVSERLTTLYDVDDLALLFEIVDGKPSVPSVKRCFSMTALDGTEVIEITANTKNPDVSADMCNIMAEIAPEFLIRVVGAGSVEIIDTASPEKKPVSPNVPMVSLIGAVVGFVIALWIIIIVDVFDDTVKESEELSKRYKKAILGEVQTIMEEKTKNSGTNNAQPRSISLLTDKGIPFNVVESYKSIRSNIMFTLGTTDKKIIAVSSPNPSEGKSTTAANIAIALAQTDNSVLLIDADLRKPVQHRIFRTRNTDGLSTLIIQKSTIETAVKKHVLNNLDLLTSGPIPPNPSELLSSERFKELFDELVSKYDYVVIDTPPVNVVSDALVIKDSISGILLVLKYAFTTHEDVAGCMKQIEMADIDMLGFVLNEVDNSRTAYYSKYKYKYKYYGGKGYGYGYGYGSRPKTEESSEPDGESDA